MRVLFSCSRRYFTMTSKVGMTITMLLAGVSSMVIAQEKKLDRSQLPPAVEKTVQAQSQGATIRGFSTDREGGKRVYEVQMTVDGHTKDVEIAADGTLNEIEEEVLFDSLAGEVKAALHAEASGAKIVKV